MFGAPWTFQLRAAMRAVWALLLSFFALLFLMGCANDHHGSIESTTLTWSSIVRVMLLQDHNTRTVVIGTMLLGIAAGVVGSYMLLRKRALMGDALSHATLPGIACAFIVMVMLGGTGKSLAGLLLGATIAGLLGVGAIMVIRKYTRIKEDAALGIVLSVTFGLGIALLTIIQRLPTGNQAGLETFIYGKTASMLASDRLVITIAAGVVIACCALLYKEFKLLSFDTAFAGAQGWPVQRLDIIMMMLVTIVTVIGLQAVGLILIISLLIIPAAAARFWTERLRSMLFTAATIGAASGYFGASLSALRAKLPAGAIIVLVAAGIFLISMVFGAKRGVLPRWLVTIRLQRRVAHQHLLRALYEWEEGTDDDQNRTSTMPWNQLVAERSWTMHVLQRIVRRAERRDLVESSRGGVALTNVGRIAAARVVRNHRMWEMYLIAHADIAPSHVDRDADQIEHVLKPGMIEELEALLAAEGDLPDVPASPHVIQSGSAT